MEWGTVRYTRFYDIEMGSMVFRLDAIAADGTQHYAMSADYPDVEGDYSVALGRLKDSIGQQAYKAPSLFGASWITQRIIRA